MDLFGEEPQPTEETVVVSEPVEPEEGLLHPRDMDFCLGHEEAEQQLLDAFNAGRMPHGLIFAGQKGIGKATMAYRLAKFLLKYGAVDPNQSSMFDAGPAELNSLDVDPEDPIARRVASGGHADFMSIERAYDATKNKYAESVAVAEIRKVPSFLRMTAADGGWRVVIIDDADTMNRNAQNALLKILEEPPKNALLILVTHRMGALIPTIRSRTQVINFQPLPQEHIEMLLSKQGAPVSDVQTLCALAEGSAGKAVQYAEEGGLESLGQILSFLNDCPNWDWPKIHALADTLAANGQDQAYKNFQDLLSWVFSQLVVAKARGQALSPEILKTEALQTFLTNSSLEKLLKICENLHTHFVKVSTANLDKRQGILSAFSIIAA